MTLATAAVDGDRDRRRGGPRGAASIPEADERRSERALLLPVRASRRGRARGPRPRSARGRGGAVGIPQGGRSVVRTRSHPSGSGSSGSGGAAAVRSRGEARSGGEARSASEGASARSSPPSLASTKPFVALLAAALSVQFLVVRWHHRRHDRRVLGTARGDDDGDDGDDGGGDDDDDRDDDPAGPARAVSLDARSATERLRRSGVATSPARDDRGRRRFEVLPGGNYRAMPEADEVARQYPTTAHLAPHVPPLPPFFEAEGPNGVPDAEGLVADVYSGERPTIMGTWLILSRFVRAMRESNREMAERDEVEAEDVHERFVSLVQTHLSPLDEAYRGRPIFPIRDDDSIFVSLASFRDHLLGGTLKGIFDQAKHPEKLFVGAVVQNCFGLNPYPGEPGVQCRTGAQMVGKVNGRDRTKVIDAPPDRNGVEEFCSSSKEHKRYCENGQIRVLYLHEDESLGPAMARYYASKLWGGESYYAQFDAHIHFYKEWDELYVHELKSAKSFPKAMLSSYPPGTEEGFKDNGGILEGNKPSRGTLLCACNFAPTKAESHILRIDVLGRYSEDLEHPAQIPFVAAGFFFVPASFLVDVPFDPYMPWTFMGEEIMLSMRAYTHGWDAYAPRRNWIEHQYRPGRMGLPKFWQSVSRLFGTPGPGFSTQLQQRTIKRAKHLLGYEKDEGCCTREQLVEDGTELVLTDVEHYGFGEARSRDEFMQWANIDVDARECRPIDWCADGKLRISH